MPVAASYSMELVECPRTALLALLSLRGTAHAGHASGTPNPAAIRPMQGMVDASLHVEGTARPPLEYHIHAEIYRARADVNAVMHTHPQWSTFLTMTGVKYQPVYAQGVLLGVLAVQRMADPQRPMPPIAVEQRPSAADRAVISAWVENGMPAGACGALH